MQVLVILNPEIESKLLYEARVTLGKSVFVICEEIGYYRVTIMSLSCRFGRTSQF